MRRMLRILGWMGMGVSAVLFVATVVLWVRSIGSSEFLVFHGFEPRTDWTFAPQDGNGIWRRWGIRTIHGRLWIDYSVHAPGFDINPKWTYGRSPFPGDKAEEFFEDLFTPGEIPFGDGLARTWRFAGAAYTHRVEAVRVETGYPRIEEKYYAVPFWMLALLFGPWPTLFVARRLLWRKRDAKGLCPNCGYDLRATPDRCPECGRVPPTAEKPEAPAIGGEE